MFKRLCPPSWGKMNTNLLGLCERRRTNGLFFAWSPAHQSIPSPLDGFISQFHPFITELEISKWGRSHDGHSAIATLLWTLAQSFTSNLRWAATKLDETELFRSHLGLCREPRSHLSAILLYRPIASCIPNLHSWFLYSAALLQPYLQRPSPSLPWS